MIHVLSRSFCAVSLLATYGIAQASQGPFVACPIYLTVGDNTLGPTSPGLLSRNESYYKRAGFYDLAAAASPALPTRPDFSMDAMFGSGRPMNFRTDAMSSGYCTVFCAFEPGTGDAMLTLPTNAWGALLFSVSRASNGGVSTAVSHEATQPDGAGADLFSLVLPGSILPSSLGCVPVGEAQRATDSGEMGFASAPGQLPEMTDFDPFFTFYRCADPIPSYLVDDPWLYFSLPTPVATIPALLPWFQTRNGVPLPAPHNTPQGATILRMQWLSTASPPHWTQPEVFLSYQELGLLANDDIDALSVDEAGFVQLSLRRSPTRQLVGHQLMVAGFSLVGTLPVVHHTARPYLYDDGTDAKAPVAKIAGADSGGEIDASCEIDPSNANGVAASVFGYIRDCRSDLPYPVTMPASAFATAGGAGIRRHAVSVAGLPPSSVAGVVVGFPAPGGGPVINGPGLLFFPTGSTLTYEWSAPARPTLLGWQLDFQWVALSGSTITLARTVRIRI